MSTKNKKILYQKPTGATALPERSKKYVFKTNTFYSFS